MSPFPWTVEEWTPDWAPERVGLSIVDANGDTVCDFYVNEGYGPIPHENATLNAVRMMDVMNAWARRQRRTEAT